MREKITLQEALDRGLVRLIIGRGDNFPKDMLSYSDNFVVDLADVALHAGFTEWDDAFLNAWPLIDSFSDFAKHQYSQLRKPDGRKELSLKQAPKKKGSVYVMENTRNGFFKIGFTAGIPEHRERTLQSEEPEIELSGVWRGTMDDEQRLHSIFSHKRLRGEWFNLDIDDLSLIHQYFEDMK